MARREKPEQDQGIPPDPPAPAPPDTAAPAPGILEAREVAAFRAQRQGRIDGILAAVAEERPVPEPELQFALTALGPDFDRRLQHAKAIVAAAAEVAAGQQAVSDYAAEGERLRATWREALAAKAAFDRWIPAGSEQWRTLAWVRERATADIHSASVAAQAHDSRAGFAQQALAEAKVRRAALDKVPPERAN